MRCKLIAPRALPVQTREYECALIPDPTTLKKTKAHLMISEKSRRCSYILNAKSGELDVSPEVELGIN